MATTVPTPPSLRPKDRWQEWPMPQTVISPNPNPNQYFPQGPYGR